MSQPTLFDGVPTEGFRYQYRFVYGREGRTEPIVGPIMDGDLDAALEALEYVRTPKRLSVPPLTFSRLERRVVGEWEPCTSPTPAAGSRPQSTTEVR